LASGGQVLLAGLGKRGTGAMQKNVTGSAQVKELLQFIKTHSSTAIYKITGGAVGTRINHVRGKAAAGKAVGAPAKGAITVLAGDFNIRPSYGALFPTGIYTRGCH
jgi:hypothetical protein